MQNSSPPSTKPGPTGVRVQSLSSGSSGNAYLVQGGSTTLLIDCGVGIRQVQSTLWAWGLDFGDVSALVVTHEHSDHVRSLEQVQRRQVPLYATAGTIRALGLATCEGQLLACGYSSSIGDVSIHPVQTSHDASEPCGLVLSIGERTVGLFTDMGEVSDGVREAAAGCDLLILESNHDREMLRTGPYPAPLKRRVASHLGHLSNDQAATLVTEVSTGHSGPAEVWLAHLSATNNTPAVALATVQTKLRGRKARPAVSVLPRSAPGPVWTGSAIRPRQLLLFDEMTGAISTA